MTTKPETPAEVWAAAIEALAAIEHERWSHWQRYLHEQCTRNADGTLTIPEHLVARWSSQLSRSYEQLTEKEKESDREQVHRYLPEIMNILRIRDVER